MLVAALAACLASATAANAATPEPLFSGPSAGGGAWAVSGEHMSSGVITGICLHVSATLADGSSAGQTKNCVAGVLHGVHNVFPVVGRSGAGAGTKAYVIGGVTVSQARTVHFTFANGSHAQTTTRKAPEGWGAMMGAQVSYFAADLLASSRSRLRSITVYDRRHRRVGRTSHVSVATLR